MHTIPDFIGLDTHYPLADSDAKVRRVHLDSAASPLAMRIALDSYQGLLAHYSNTHSYVHHSARITTHAFAWAQQQILSSLGANEDDYACVFMGSGCTAAINRIARGLAELRQQRPIALVSSMEHHANDLPHRAAGLEVIHIPLQGASTELGAIDLQALETLLQQHRDKINYIALSAISNVTGIINPINEIVALARQYDVLTLIDAAQMVAHMPTELSAIDADFLVFSGHKVYTPGAPGVLIAKQLVLKTLPGQDMGGGSVSHVDYYGYELLSHFPDREQSGTPNITGAISLATVIKTLDQIGFKTIEQHALALMEYALSKLKTINGICIYGAKEVPRIGALAFNIENIDHGLLAAILNDYFGIAVRNECFCAHPYVSAMLKTELWELDLTGIPETQHEAYINRKRGMVRISFGLYNTREDIDYFTDSLRALIERIDEYRPNYLVDDNGVYSHKTFALSWRDYFNPDALLP